MAEERTVKPSGGPAGPGAKGAMVSPGPNSAIGPNETEDGVIKHPAPEGPGEDQPHLLGGNPAESLQSTPNLEPAPKASPKK